MYITGDSRFQDTLEALRECRKHMSDEDLSESEGSCRKKLTALCAEITRDFVNPHAHYDPEDYDYDRVVEDVDENDYWWFGCGV